MTRALTIAIAAGGTGGHMFPAEVLARELTRRGHSIFLISDARGLSFGLFKGAEAYRIESATFAGRGLGGRVGALVPLMRGFFRAWWILLKRSPQGVVGFGGYPVLPTMMAARSLSLPYCLHEQNAVLGRANRAVARRASAIALSFPKTRKLGLRGRRRATFTGNPVRAEIAAIGKKPYPSLGPDHVVRLLVTGGSQGARLFAEVVPEALAMLPKAVRARLQVTQQARPEDKQRVREAYEKAGIAAEVYKFIHDMPDRLLWAHLVIGRAGATTLSELAAAGRPAVLVPLAAAIDDHQSRNAGWMADAGGAWVIAEKDFSAVALARLAQKLVTRKQLLTDAAAKARSLAQPEAASRLADLVEDMIFTRFARERPGEKRAGEPGGPSHEFREAAA